MKKNIAVFLPDLPQKSFIKPLADSLFFLSDYNIEFIDPYDIHLDVSNEEYYRCWQQQINTMMDNYDVFFGFSFGGVILQQCLSLFEHQNKQIILFSTPTYANDALTKKLSQVVSLCKQHQLNEALSALYQHVYYPNKHRQQSYAIDNVIQSQDRVIFGLQRVLATDSTEIVKHTKVDHLHLIGEFSDLVNQDNVIAPKTGELIIIPQAGMRVLQDNLPFCRNIILDRLNREL